MDVTGCECQANRRRVPTTEGCSTRWLRNTVTVIVTCALFVGPSGIPAHARPPSSANTANRLEDVKDALQAADDRKAATLGQLQAVSARRAELDRGLSRLEERVSTAQSAVAKQEQELARATAELVHLDRRAQHLREQSQRDRLRMGETAQAVYELGPLRYADVLLGSGDLGDLGHAAKYAEVLMEHQQDVVEAAVKRESDTVTVVARVESLRDRLVERREAVTAERDRVVALQSERQALRRRLEAEAQRQQAMLEAIEADRARYTELLVALEEESARVAQTLRARSTSSTPGTASGLAWPTDGPVTSPFGWRTHPISGVGRLHTGVDIGAASGTSVRAAKAGSVVSAGWLGGYGNAVVLDHGNGLSTLYAHQSSLAVGAGEGVEQGQVIGAVGATGYVTGPHLHFEVRVDGDPIDPGAHR